MVPPLDELCKTHEEEAVEEVEDEDEEGSYHAHLEGLIQNLLKEAKDKSKAWVSRSFSDNTEIASKKVKAHRFLKNVTVKGSKRPLGTYCSVLDLLPFIIFLQLSPL